jgi:hypothetical protein
MSELKLIALDAEDLGVVSAHLQDAVLKVGDMAYLPRERRFAAMLNRFDWTSVGQAGARRPRPVRRRCALRFERVLSASVLGLDLGAKPAVLALLAIQFQPALAPAGGVLLTFAGGGQIRLDVECIEAELRDLGPAWAARRKPDHGDGREETDKA